MIDVLCLTQCLHFFIDPNRKCTRKWFTCTVGAVSVVDMGTMGGGGTPLLIQTMPQLMKYLIFTCLMFLLYLCVAEETAHSHVCTQLWVYIHNCVAIPLLFNSVSLFGLLIDLSGVMWTVKLYGFKSARPWLIVRCQSNASPPICYFSILSLSYQITEPCTRGFILYQSKSIHSFRALSENSTLIEVESKSELCSQVKVSFIIKASIIKLPLNTNAMKIN